MPGTKQAITMEHLQSLAGRTDDRLSELATAVLEALGEINEAMTGATANAAGTKGMVPAPAAGKQGAFLRGDGTWAQPSLAGAAFYIGPTAPSDPDVIWFKTRS